MQTHNAKILTCDVVPAIRKENPVKRKRSPASGLRPVEILHIETSGSRQLCKDLNPFQKADSEKLFKDFFRAMCGENGARSIKWNGDGGFALFASSKEKEIGASVRAGEQLLKKLPLLNAQTAKQLSIPSFARHVRLPAHRGEICLTRDQDVHSAIPKHFDDFLKHEKRFAPKNDELFITRALFELLPVNQKERFDLFKKSITAGSLRTALYLLKKVPVPEVENIFKHGDQVSEITQAEWNYLRTAIFAQYANVAARNQITKGLIQHLARKPLTERSLIPSSLLLRLTLDALFSYLRVAFSSVRIRVSYWRATERRGEMWLKMVTFRYPEGESTNPTKRCVPAKDVRYKVCEAFAKQESIVTPSVEAARLQGNWEDFDGGQSLKSRSLDSALQIPVYCARADHSRDVKGVLCLDADKPNMFVREELALWRDDMVGFLANLALAEKLRSRGA